MAAPRPRPPPRAERRESFRGPHNEAIQYLAISIRVHAARNDAGDRDPFDGAGNDRRIVSRRRSQQGPWRESPQYRPRRPRNSLADEQRDQRRDPDSAGAEPRPGNRAGTDAP